MSWEFETEPEFQSKLDWMKTFVQEEIEPLDALWPHDVYRRPMDPDVAEVIRPLQQRVRDEGLWASHLGPELGGLGLWATEAGPDERGPRSLALGPDGVRYPGPGHRQRGDPRPLRHPGAKGEVLQPLLNGDIVSSFSMTEPQGGSDPRPVHHDGGRDGDHWVINGWKFFSSHASGPVPDRSWRHQPREAASTAPSPCSWYPAKHGSRDRAELRACRARPRGRSGSHGLVHYNNVRVPVGQHAWVGEGKGFLWPRPG